MTEEKNLTAKERSAIASKAQAKAHRVLREKHPAEYSKAYESAKVELTEERLSGGGAK